LLIFVQSVNVGERLRLEDAEIVHEDVGPHTPTLTVLASAWSQVQRRSHVGGGLRGALVTASDLGGSPALAYFFSARWYWDTTPAWVAG
jgi:hypothetical protein